MRGIILKRRGQRDGIAQVAQLDDELRLKPCGNEARLGGR